MSLRSHSFTLLDRSRLTAALRRTLALAQEAALMLSLAGSVCLSWPQVPRSIVLATKIVVYYCFSPR
jgi:hypothetical protein